MKKTAWHFITIMLALVGVISLSACQAEQTPKAEYVSIAQDEAKKIMDGEEDYIILDVRTQGEYDASHIEGAVLIPYDEIESRAASELPDKEQIILVYCRSGNRSKTASQSLAGLGYTNVREFGGISTWQYGTVQ